MQNDVQVLDMIPDISMLVPEDDTYGSKGML